MLGGEDAGDVRAVTVVVHRVAVVVQEVLAALVVDAELGVDDVGLVVRVVVDVVDAGVDDRDLDALPGVAREVHLAAADVLDAPRVLVLEVAGVGSVVEGREHAVDLDGRRPPGPPRAS